MFAPHYKPLSDRPTIIDEFMARTVLLAIPRSVRPNLLTVIRFVSVPFVIYLLYSGFFLPGIILFSISAFTDVLDGAMARTRDQITDWGKVYDPLADKLLIGLSLMVLVGRFLNLALALVIVFLEVVIILISVWRKYVRGEEIQAKKVGKIKMILQSFGVGFLLLGIVAGVPFFISVAYVLLFISIIFSILSIVKYGSI